MKDFLFDLIIFFNISRQKYVDFYRSIALNLSKLRSNEVENHSFSTENIDFTSHLGRSE